MKRWMLSVLLSVVTAVSMGQTLQVWSVDPLSKVFKGDLPSSTSVEAIDVARGEHVEWQLVVRSDAPLKNLKVTPGSLRSEAGSMGRPRVRFVSYVHVDRSMAQPAKDLLRTAPADYPDPLMPTAPAELPAQTSQPIWLDLAVGPDVAPGTYEATVKVSGEMMGRQVRADFSVRMKVHGATVGKSRLWVTNWFFTSTGHMPGSNKPGSKEEDAYLRQLARSMAAHRQNVALISPLELAKYSWGPDGKLNVDFSRFDTWVSIFKKAGVIGRIEGGHIGGRVSDAWESQFGVNIRFPDKGGVGAKQVAPDSAEAIQFYSQFFPQLVKHLKAKRWLGIYSQHLGDEPIDANHATYDAMAALIHKYAPELKVIEATHTKTLVGSVQVWVPQLNFAHESYDFYKERQAKGEEFWTYTCVWPEGEYANRFIELPLIKTRLLHWLNYRYGITGYLHWGFNYWVKDDPFEDVTRTKAKDGWGGFLPAGDSWIVYPKDGQLIDSIRYETMRDGIADYELLAMLGEKDPKEAQKLAKKLILSFDRYDTDVKSFRAVRRRLLEQLSKE